MPTVSAGATASYTFTARQNVTITTDPDEMAVVSVFRGTQTLFSSAIRSIVTIGPYLSGDVLTVTAQRGAIDYTITDAPDASSVSGAGTLSSVVYDGSGRATSWTYNGDSYTVSGWGTSTVTISKNGTAIRTLTLNGSGQMTASAAA